MRCRPDRQSSYASLLLLGFFWCMNASAAQPAQLASNFAGLHGPARQGDKLGRAVPSQITPWIQIDVEPGDTLSGLFQQSGLEASQWRTLLELGPIVDPLRHLTPGDHFELRKTLDGRLAALRFPLNPLDTLVVQRDHNGLSATIAQLNSHTRTVRASGTVGESLPTSLRRVGVPGEIATALSNIYRWRTDLSSTIRPGDRFSVIYAAEFVDGKRVAAGPVIAASIHTHGRSYKAFRRIDTDGDVHYYDSRGRPYQPSIERTPLDYEHVSSPFDRSRVHPVLDILRPHNGVDLAAERGTPVHAAADGTVTFVGWMHGYGRIVKIDHFMGYSTRYAHMADFAAGLEEGDKVQQGQIIGTVGASGTVTGTHLHYEIRQDGIAHNPLVMNLPDGQPLASSQLPAFTKRIQPLIARLGGDPAMPHTLIASNTGLGAYQSCAEAATINAAVALAPARVDHSALDQIFCVSPGPTRVAMLSDIG